MKDDKPTSFDIAYKAGVSQATVSRALRDSPLVSQETRDKVKAVAAELNYKVDKNARNLRSQKTRTIALLLCEDPGTGDSLINPFFLSMLSNIIRAAAKRGYDVLISFQQLSDDWQAEYENANRADGIIFLGYGDYITYSAKAEKWVEAKAHFITWGPVLPGQPGHSIGCDNVLGGYDAARHLLKLGHRRIAFVGDISEHCPEFHQRYLGFVKAMNEAKLDVDISLQVPAIASEEDGYRAMQLLLEGGKPLDAVFGASDSIAIGAIKALRDGGVQVPKDVSVIGFDDIPAASYTNPPLTTVHQNTSLAGEMLVENLLKLIEGEAVESMLLPARLIVRDSCGEEHNP
jgi:DNA-binding LacI/PurR family transcriptional regulator